MKIGIVTISFNQRQFLAEAMSSVTMNRREVNVRYVVVDAGSTDGSLHLIQSREAEIDTVISEPDEGPGDGLNKGFKACQDCDVFGYINADDRFTRGALAWAENFFCAHPDVDVLQGAVGMIDAAGRPSVRSRVCDEFTLSKYLAGACNVFQQGTFFRRKIFSETNGFNPSNRTCWDTELIVDMALAGARFRRTLCVLGEFRIHSESITGAGRSHVQYALDQERIRNRITESGVGTYPEFTEALLRAQHRASPFRHAAYLLAHRPKDAAHPLKERSPHRGRN